MPNFTIIGQIIADIWRFLIFQDCGRCYLGFLKCRTFRFWKGQEAQNASLYQISLRSVKPHEIWRLIFPRWQPSTVLYLRWACLDHPRRAFGGLCHCAKFGWNGRSSFDNMHVLRFHQFDWKTIHAHRIGVLGIWPPKWQGISTKPPKGTFVGGKTSYWHIDRQNRSTGATYADLESLKQKHGRETQARELFKNILSPTPVCTPFGPTAWWCRSDQTLKPSPIPS